MIKNNNEIYAFKDKLVMFIADVGSSPHVDRVIRTWCIWVTEEN